MCKFRPKGLIGISVGYTYVGRKCNRLIIIVDFILTDLNFNGKLIVEINALLKDYIQ